MSIWNWITTYLDDGRREGNLEKYRLFRTTIDALEFMDSDPDQMIQRLMQARQMAERLNEPWWQLFCDHWMLQALLFRKREYKESLDKAVKAAVETRKPAFATFPQRACLHEDLIYAYVGIDPDGYAAAIQSALDYMAQEITPDMECHHCLQSLRTEFCMARRDWDAAFKEGYRYLALSANEDHHLVSAYGHLCEVAFHTGDWERLAQWAAAGEEVARRADKDYSLGEMLLWQAVTARQKGDDAAATPLVRAALSHQKSLASTPPRPFMTALAAYHELGGELEQAIQVREWEISLLEGKGELISLARAQVERCRLLAGAGRLTDEDRKRARNAAAKLKNPNSDGFCG